MDGIFAGGGGRGGEIDEVVGVNDERIDIVLEARGGQDPHLLLVRRFSAPHARAGGKNLHGIRADLVSVDDSAFKGSASIGVNADAHLASIAGKRRLCDIEVEPDLLPGVAGSFTVAARRARVSGAPIRHSDIVKLASDAISPRIYWLPVAPIGE